MNIQDFIVAALIRSLDTNQKLVSLSKSDPTYPILFQRESKWSDAPMSRSFNLSPKLNHGDIIQCLKDGKTTIRPNQFKYFNP
jgi:hypothetical protein